MNLGEIRDELRDLGFEEDSTMVEYNDIFLHAVNRATWLVYDTVVIRLKGYYKKVLSEKTEVEVVMHLNDDDTTTITTTTTTTIGDFEPVVSVDTETRPTEDGDRNSIRTNESVKPWYPVRPEVLDESSDDETVIGLPDNTLRITALLAAYYLWLDDDETKAVYYYNMFETFMRTLIETCEMDARATVITNGWGW